MSETGPRDDGAKLRKFLSQFLAGELDTERFCGAFEKAYNFTDKASLTEPERAAFGALFEEVVYYSPFPEERATIPNYRNEGEIWQAAERASAIL